MIEDVFGYHPAVFNDAHKHLRLVGSPHFLDIAEQFYKQNFVQITIKAGRGGYEIAEEDFIEKTVLAESSGQRNNRYFLLGKVGSGKTTFINYLISKYGESWAKNNNLWFIRLDIYLLDGQRSLTVERLVDGLATKIIRVFRSYKELLEIPQSLNKDFENLVNIQGASGLSSPSLLHKQLALTTFISKYNLETKKRFVLIIDNSDYIYHLNDRLLFTDKGACDELNNIQGIENLVNSFSHDANNVGLGDLGANVIFVLRPDSYEILQTSTRLFAPEDIYSFDRCAFSMGVPDWKEILQKRGDLLNFVTHKNSKGSGLEAKKLIEAIIRDLELPLEDGGKLFDHLEKITNYGLRDIMRFFQQYSWLEGQDHLEGRNQVGLERLIHSYPVGLLAFILDGRRRFSQFYSKFPNIYCVNYQEESIESQGWVDGGDHPHTYWLMRLLLEFISTKGKSEEAVTLSDIKGAFCIGTKSYDEGLVRLCLGNFAEAKLANLVSVKRSKASNEDSRIHIQDLNLTRRGQHCLDFLFDKFLYLQLVVDDYNLPIPGVLKESFSFANKPDYSYIGLQPGQYGELAAQMIKIKAKQVLLFLEVLEEALKIEKEKYRDCFETLKEQNINIPSVKIIRSNVIEELKSLNSRYQFINLDAVLAEVSSIKEKIQSFMLKAYSKDGKFN